MIGCSEAVQQLWAYIDGSVDSSDRALVEEHLSRCRTCCGELEFAKELRKMLAEPSHEQVSPDLIRRLHETIEELGR
jgi:mycothiol system anti-sigma-R factor